ncbi:SMI1/KNR4 family protein [Kitasatospora sp. NPDC101155]|uniref:SMI1/KNR4 family protein n=1 Tax=Kitasatospora sp. NPDC101155 TaxID=3364097 RepID=UPI0037F5C5E3
MAVVNWEDWVSDPAPALTLADIRDVEQAIGVSLPEDLRRHYLWGNGGFAIRSEFILPERGLEYDVAEWDSMKYLRSAEGVLFEDTYRRLVRDRKLIPDQLIPFAVNGGGDFFCMDRATQGIVFYVMDYCAEPEVAIRHLTGSLREFLDILVTEEGAMLKTCGSVPGGTRRAYLPE